MSQIEYGEKLARVAPGLIVHFHLQDPIKDHFPLFKRPLATEELKQKHYRLEHDEFVNCAEEGKAHEVRLFLEAGFDPASCGNKRMTPLIAAAKEGHLQTVRQLLQHEDVALNWKSLENGDTALIASAAGGYDQVVEALVSQPGIDLNLKNKKGDTALLAACRGGHAEAAAHLLSRQETDVNLADIEGNTPLYLAAFGGYETIARDLLAREDVDLNLRNRNGDSPWVAAVVSHSPSIESLLKEKKADPAGAEEKRAQLYLAGLDLLSKKEFFQQVESGKVDLVHKFLVAGFDVNLQDENGDSPLLIASRIADVEKIRLLLATEKVDIDARNKNGVSALLEAATQGHQEIVELLKEKGAKEPELEKRAAQRRLGEAFTEQGFLESVRKGHIEAVREHLLAGRPPDTQDSEGTTAFLLAARERAHQICEVLADAGADLLARNDADESALFFAVRNQDQLLESLLRDRGLDEPDLMKRIARHELEDGGTFTERSFVEQAQLGELDKVKKFLLAGMTVNARNDDGDTALIVAARLGDVALVELLLDRDDVKLDLRNKKRLTATISAAIADHPRIVDLLVERGATGREELTAAVARWRLGEDGIPFDPETFLAVAQEGRTRTVKLFIEAGMEDLDVQDASGNTALILAVREGFIAVAELLLEAGANVDAENQYGVTALAAAIRDDNARIEALLRKHHAKEKGLQEVRLFKAVETGDLGALRLAFEEGASTEVRNEAGDPPLVVAVSRNRKDVAELLLGHGASPDARDATGKSALMRAAEADQTDLIRLLIDRGADREAKARDGSTALIQAASRGHKLAVETLIQKGARLDATDNEGRSALTAAKFGNYGDVVRILCGAGAQEDSLEGELFQAAIVGDAEKIRKLIGKRIHLDQTDRNGNTALMLAAKRGWIDAARALLEAHAQREVKNGDGDTALILAARSGRAQVVECLLEHHANPNAMNKEGRTALMEAAAFGAPLIVELLARSGSDVAVTARDGTTALIEACHQGSLRAVKALLDQNANINERVRFGRTPWMTAALECHQRVLDYLEEKQAKEGVAETELFLAARSGDESRAREILAQKPKPDMEAQDKRGRTALLEAIERGNLGVMKALLDAGADASHLARDRTSPLMLAASKGQTAILALLVPRVGEEEKAATSALLAAARNGHAEAVRQLLGKGSSARINGTERGTPPLVAAAANGHIEVVQVLLNAQAETDKPDPHGKTALARAILGGHHPIAQLLLEHGAQDVGVRDANLIMAAAEGDKLEVDRLLTSKVNLDARDEKGRTALMRACENGGEARRKRKLEVAKSLLQHLETEEERTVAVNAVDQERRTPLMYAAEAGNDGLVKFLLDHLPNVSARSKKNRTALLEACRQGYPTIVRLLLSNLGDRESQQAEVNAEDQDGNTPFKEACLGRVRAKPQNQWKFRRILELLVTHGAVRGKLEAELLAAAPDSDQVNRLSQLLGKGVDTETKTGDGQTALMLAAQANNLLGLKVLLAKGAQVDVQTSVGQTALIFASRQGHDLIVKALLGAHADVNLATQTGTTAVMEAARNGHDKVIDLLLQNGASPGAKLRKSGATALILAAQEGHRLVVKSLLRGNVDVDQTDHDGRSALMVAHLGRWSYGFSADLLDQWAGNPTGDEASKLSPVELDLIVKGARAGWNEAELILAAREGDVEWAKRLVAATSVQAKDLEGRTALLTSAQRGDLGIVENLLKEGADRNVASTALRTPLMESAKGGHREVVEALLQRDVVVDARDQAEDTALLEAARAGKEDILGLLIDAGAEVNLQNREGETPLLAAVKAGSQEAVRLLIRRHGANLCFRTPRGRRTAIMEAAARGHTEILRDLFDELRERLGEDEPRRLLVVNNFSRAGCTSLDLAIAGGHSDCADLIRANGGISVEDTGFTVYTAPNGARYHREECGSINQARENGKLKKWQIYEARSRGYESCNICKADHAAFKALGLLDRERSADWSC